MGEGIHTLGYEASGNGTRVGCIVRNRDERCGTMNRKVGGVLEELVTKHKLRALRRIVQ